MRPSPPCFAQVVAAQQRLAERLSETNAYIQHMETLIEELQEDMQEAHETLKQVGTPPSPRPRPPTAARPPARAPPTAAVAAMPSHRAKPLLRAVLCVQVSMEFGTTRRLAKGALAAMCFGVDTADAQEKVRGSRRPARVDSRPARGLRQLGQAAGGQLGGRARRQP